MKYLYTITLLLISLQCFSQVMVESTGEFRYNKKKVTKEEAQDYALMDARRKAAQQVGVDVTQYEILSVKDNKQTYRLITNSQTNAVVQIIEQEFEYTKKCVRAKVKALVYKTHGDSFIKVSGIASVYQITDCINFDVVFYENGYFYVFGLATEEKGVQIYPNMKENGSNYYTEKTIKSFPTLRNGVWYIPVRRVKNVNPKYLDSMPNRDFNRVYFCESGRYNTNMIMFFVLLKSPHPFKYGKVTYNNIVKWYTSIPEEDKNGMEIKVFTVEE